MEIKHKLVKENLQRSFEFKEYEIIFIHPNFSEEVWLLVNFSKVGDEWCFGYLKTDFLLPREVIMRIESILRGLNNGRN